MPLIRVFKGDRPLDIHRNSWFLKKVILYNGKINEINIAKFHVFCLIFRQISNIGCQYQFTWSQNIDNVILSMMSNLD